MWVEFGKADTYQVDNVRSNLREKRLYFMPSASPQNAKLCAVLSSSHSTGRSVLPSSRPSPSG